MPNFSPKGVAMGVDPEDIVHRLMLQSIADRDALSNAGWAAHVDQLCQDLLCLQPDVDQTLVAVVRASIVVQQLLLDLGDVPQRFTTADIIDAAGGLLDDLYDQCAAVETGPTLVAAARRTRTDNSQFDGCADPVRPAENAANVLESPAERIGRLCALTSTSLPTSFRV